MNFYFLIPALVIILSLVEYYFIKRINKLLSIACEFFWLKNKRLLLRIYLLIINTYPSFLIFSWGYASIRNESAFVPQNIFFDALILFPFWWMIIFTIQIILFILLLDIIRLLIWTITRKVRGKIFKIESYLVLALTIFFIFYVPFRFWYDYTNISISEYELPINNLPEGISKLRIIFISDTQADRYTNKIRLSKFIYEVNSLKPDLVLIGGDVITSTPDYIQTGAEFLGRIKSKYGVYSCVGDHDNWAYRNDYQRSRNEVKAALLKNDVKMLDNESMIIPFGDFKIFLSFTTNTYMDKTSDEIFNSLSGRDSNADFKIMVTHQPIKSVISNSVKNKFDLILAGHTHGGQITFLFPFFNLSPTIFETKFLRGEYDFGNTKMIICRGLGMSLAPVRYNSTPEIILIQFNKSE